MPTFRELDGQAARDAFSRLSEILIYRAAGSGPPIEVRGIVEPAAEAYPDDENIAIGADALVVSLLLEETPNAERGDRLERAGLPPLVIDQLLPKRDEMVVSVVVNEVER